MQKVRIGFYTHHWDYAGTARSHEQIALNINKELFDPFILYWPGANNPRLSYLEGKLGKNNLIPFDRSLEKTDAATGYTPVKNNLKEVCQQAKLDILHVARGGHYEWPFVDRMCPIQVETKIFTDMEPRTFVDWSFPIVSFVGYPNKQSIIPNPISYPVTDPSIGSFRGEVLPEGVVLNKETMVYGRIGREGNWTDHGILGFKAALQINPNSYFIVISPCPEDRAFYSSWEHKDRVLLIDPTSDDRLIQKFFNTLDVFLHYRADGEVCSVAIAQAMANKLPVVSHKSNVYNGQVEMLYGCGFVADSKEAYVEFVKRLAQDRHLRTFTGTSAYQKYQMVYSPEAVLPLYETEYISLYIERNFL